VAVVAAQALQALSMSLTPARALEPSLREAHLTLSAHMLMYGHLFTRGGP
jgi:hypothetical protein